MTTTTTFLLLRHAHTDANEHGSTPRMAGWVDIPVSDRGEAQLRTLADVSFEGLSSIVYSSTSPRAIRTAAAAAGGRTVIPLRALREISCGDVDGWLIRDVERRYPELWRRNLAQDDPGFGWPGGESYDRFRRRVLRVLRGIARRHPGERVLVATHAGVIAQAVGQARGVSAAAWEKHRPANCSVTTIEWDEDDTVRLVEFDFRLADVATAADALRSG